MGTRTCRACRLNDTATPLERPKEFADKPFFTEAEAVAYQQTYQLERVRQATGDELFGDVGAPDLDTFEPGHVLPSRRTSLIVDPSNGRVPPLTPQAQRRIAERVERVRQHYGENPENLPNSERCLVVANTAVPPLLPNVYNNTLQIVQTSSYIAIVSETIHDARIVSMGRTTHLPPAIRQWKGDSIGRWDGDTLVVDTTNFSEKTVFRGSSLGLHLTERFTVAARGILRYAFAVDDADSFSQPWSAESVFTRTSTGCSSLRVTRGITP